MAAITTPIPILLSAAIEVALITLGECCLDAGNVKEELDEEAVVDSWFVFCGVAVVACDACPIFCWGVVPCPLTELEGAALAMGVALAVGVAILSPKSWGTSLTCAGGLGPFKVGFAGKAVGD